MNWPQSLNVSETWLIVTWRNRKLESTIIFIGYGCCGGSSYTRDKMSMQCIHIYAMRPTLNYDSSCMRSASSTGLLSGIHSIIGLIVPSLLPLLESGTSFHLVTSSSSLTVFRWRLKHALFIRSCDSEYSIYLFCFCFVSNSCVNSLSLYTFIWSASLK